MTVDYRRCELEDVSHGLEGSQDCGGGGYERGRSVNIGMVAEDEHREVEEIRIKTRQASAERCACSKADRDADESY
jgi:hypothetical protein